MIGKLGDIGHAFRIGSPSSTIGPSRIILCVPLRIHKRMTSVSLRVHEWVQEWVHEWVHLLSLALTLSLPPLPPPATTRHGVGLDSQRRRRRESLGTQSTGSSGGLASRRRRRPLPAPSGKGSSLSRRRTSLRSGNHTRTAGMLGRSIGVSPGATGRATATGVLRTLTRSPWMNTGGSKSRGGGNGNSYLNPGAVWATTRRDSETGSRFWKAI